MNKLIAIILLALVHPDSSAMAATLESYLRWPGPAPVTEQVERAQQIFDILKRSTGKQTSTIKLGIINSDNEPWAAALTDGNIVLSNAALEVAYKDADTDLAEARVAFILGHELAHLFNGHHYHEEYLLAPNRLPNQREIDIQNSHNRETYADYHGFIYASVAGFHTDRILTDPDPTNEKNFLNYWVKQTGAQTSVSHPSASERTKLLLDKLSEIDIHHFEYAARLAHFGEIELAADLMEVFRKDFRENEPVEVLNSMGFIHILRAQTLLDDAQKIRFWLPALLETEIDFPVFPITRGTQNKQRRLQKEIDNALTFLNTARNMDPENTTTIVNLVIANMLNDSFATARDLLKKPIRNNPDHRVLAHLLALVEHADGKNLTEAKNALLDAQQNPVAEPYAVYNTARVLMEQNYPEQANAEFAKLSKVMDRLPNPYRQAVCDELGLDCNSFVDTKTAKIVSALESRLPVAPGSTLHAPKGWTTRYNDYSSTDLKLYHKGPDSMLVENFTVKMAVLSAASIGLSNVSQLLKQFGNPSKITSSATAELWSYGSRVTVKIKDDQIDEAWLVHRQ